MRFISLRMCVPWTVASIDSVKSSPGNTALMNLLKLGEYQIWADSIIMDCVSALSEDDFARNLGKPLGSVRERIAHIILVIEYCLSLLEGKEGEKATVKDLHGSLKSENKIGTLNLWRGADRKLLLRLKIPLEGTVFVRGFGQMTKEDYLFQCLNHTIYHRGQLKLLLRILGRTGKELDYLFFLRDQNITADEST